MEPTLDNRMIFGGIGNLRLAPHVREGRPIAPVPAVGRPAGPAAPPEGSAPASAPRSRGFVAGEKVTISAAARAAFEGGSSETSSSAEPGGVAGSQALTDEEKRELAELKARDAEVRAHEQAHKAAAAGLVTSGPTYSYTRGPDGNRYATGGEVSIDVSEVPNDPEATVRKAQRIRAAAMAPAEPSPQDRAVAAQAAEMGAAAQAEVAQQRREEQQSSDEGPASGGVVPPSVASAYAASTGTTEPAGRPSAPSAANGLFA